MGGGGGRWGQRFPTFCFPYSLAPVPATSCFVGSSLFALSGLQNIKQWNFCLFLQLAAILFFLACCHLGNSAADPFVRLSRARLACEQAQYPQTQCPCSARGLSPTGTCSQASAFLAPFSSEFSSPSPHPFYWFKVWAFARCRYCLGNRDYGIAQISGCTRIFNDLCHSLHI